MIVFSFAFRPPRTEIPQCPNVDPFNFERMKRALLERLDSFNSAPFTVQRICELLTEPRKQYTRIDKFMRAVEKNILGKPPGTPLPIAYTAGKQNGAENYALYFSVQVIWLVVVANQLKNGKGC